MTYFSTGSVKALSKTWYVYTQSRRVFSHFLCASVTASSVKVPQAPTLFHMFKNHDTDSPAGRRARLGCRLRRISECSLEKNGRKVVYGVCWKDVKTEQRNILVSRFSPEKTWMLFKSSKTWSVISRRAHNYKFINKYTILILFENKPRGNFKAFVNFRKESKSN